MSELIIQPGIKKDSLIAVFIMGPTATGKTDLGMACVESFNSEIISVDSAMVYREMDIGTAKPDAEELAKAPHRLIDMCDPLDAYSAGAFRDDALSAMAEIVDNNAVPLLVGGTMLYFNVLQKGLAKLPQADQTVRQKLDDDVKRIGWPGMHQRLSEIDPVSAERIHHNDPQRIHRALEVFEITGKTLTQFWQEQKYEALPYSVVKIALMPPDRTELRQKISLRFDQMLDAGFVDEVEKLRARGDLSPDLPSIRAVGYRQVWAYLDGEYDYETMREKAIIATAQLAKRQMTWLRKETDCNFFDPKSLNSDKLLKNLRNLLL